MLLRRIARRWIGGLLIATLLFAQLAVAAHACAALQPGSATQSDASTTMPCAMMQGGTMALDREAPGLCQQHCQFGNAQASGDAAVALSVPPFLPALLRVVNVEPADEPVRSAWVENERRRDLARPPPHSTLHCCHRC